ncbi:MAG: thiol peroxidase, partial [Calditrichaeota bacterium]
MSDTPTVTMKGNPVKLAGQPVQVGDRAPDFELIGADMQPVRLSDFRGKILVISAVPSLDTSVCDAETRKFNEMADTLGKDVAILTVSVDLPFAQKRWMQQNGVEKVICASDHREVNFGRNYGILMEDHRLLARCVFVVDREGVIR